MKRSLWSLCQLVACLCFVVVLASCASKQSPTPIDTKPKTDLEFAKSAFTALANGDTTTADGMLDWENFSSPGVNVAAQYKTQRNEVAKAGFRTGFITSFSKSFQSTGARAESLTNWRVQSQDATKTVVAADTPSRKTLLLTVSKTGGQQKISALGIG